MIADTKREVARPRRRDAACDRCLYLALLPAGPALADEHGGWHGHGGRGGGVVNGRSGTTLAPATPTATTACPTPIPIRPIPIPALSPYPPPYPGPYSGPAPTALSGSLSGPAAWSAAAAGRRRGPGHVWFYCDPAGAFFPYVKSCAVAGVPCRRAAAAQRPAAAGAARSGALREPGGLLSVCDGVHERLDVGTGHPARPARPRARRRIGPIATAKRGFAPYVGTCPTGWREVAAAPPPSAPGPRAATPM